MNAHDQVGFLFLKYRDDYTWDLDRCKQGKENGALPDMSVLGRT